MSRVEEEIRALDCDTVLAALGTDHYEPRCPACKGRLEVCDSWSWGTSIRCQSSRRCRLGRRGWSWPERFAAELWRTGTVAEAERRFLAAVEGSATVQGPDPAARFEMAFEGAM